MIQNTNLNIANAKSPPINPQKAAAAFGLLNN